MKKINGKNKELGLEKNKYDITGVKKIQSWLTSRIDDLAFDCGNIDALYYEDEISFEDVRMKKYNFYMSPLPDEFESDVSYYLDVNISDENSNVVASGNIEIYTGYIEVRTDGSVGDGCVEKVEYNTQEILDYIDGILDDYKRLYDSEKSIHSIMTEIFQPHNKKRLWSVLSSLICK